MENEEKKKSEQGPVPEKEKTFFQKFMEMPYDQSQAGQIFVFTTPMRRKEKTETAPNEKTESPEVKARKEEYIKRLKNRGETDAEIELSLEAIDFDLETRTEEALERDPYRHGKIPYQLGQRDKLIMDLRARGFSDDYIEVSLEMAEAFGVF